jgi:uncharacterized protein YjbI with pentapeptide repeats
MNSSLRSLTLGLCLFTTLLFSAVEVNAADSGFRFKDGRCLNDKGEAGYNTGFLGQCADLRGVTLSKLDFSEMDFSGSLMTDADLQNSSFTKAVLIQVDFTGAQLMGAGFNQAHIENSVFARASLQGASFDNAVIKNVDFQGADFSGQNLSGVVFDGCRFDGANFSGAKLTDSKLTKASIIKAKFENSVLDGADLSSSNLTGGDFKGASLKKTMLNKAQMSQTNLRDADLTKASVRGTSFKQAKYNRKTKLPFSTSTAQKNEMILIKFLEFSGLSKKLPISSLDGWETCSQSSYKDTVSLSDIFNSCQSKYVMLACRLKGSDTLELAAYGHYDMVFKDIGDSNEGIIDNGVKFYFSPDQSIGFAGENDQLNRNSCDFQGLNADNRLCFHTSSNSLAGGYRCGAKEDLNDDSSYERLFFKATDG